MNHAAGWVVIPGCDWSQCAYNWSMIYTVFKLVYECNGAFPQQHESCACVVCNVVLHWGFCMKYRTILMYDVYDYLRESRTPWQFLTLSTWASSGVHVCDVFLWNCQLFVHFHSMNYTAVIVVQHLVWSTTCSIVFGNHEHFLTLVIIHDKTITRTLVLR